MQTIREMDAVDPRDPFGRTGRHRSCRILVQHDDDLRALCWFRIGLDQSIYFGIPGLSVDIFGKASLTSDGRFVPSVPEDSLAHLPFNARSNVHLSLHPSGRIHTKAQGCEPFVVDDFGEWLPTAGLSNWAYFYSNPIDHLKPAGRIRRGDAIVAFPRGEMSAEVHLDLIPAVQPYPLEPKAVHTVIGLAPPHFALRVSIFHHKPVEATLFFATR